jgi:DNA-binding IclR family transcriptional regulator
VAIELFGHYDELVLRVLRAWGPGTLSVTRLADDAGLPRSTVRASAACLAAQGLVCVVPEDRESLYLVRHLHAYAGPCEYSLQMAIHEPGAR